MLCHVALFLVSKGGWIPAFSEVEPPRKKTRRPFPHAAGEERLEERALLAADFGFALAFGDTNNDDVLDVAADAAGNVYATGDFFGTIDFDPGPGVTNLTGSGQSTFIAKYTSSGALVWARGFSATTGGSVAAVDIAVDSSGNVYTTGDFALTADCDPGAGVSNLTSSGGFNAFVLKLNNSGNFVWARSLEAATGSSASGIAVNSSGAVFTTGNFGGTADFDPLPGANVVNLTSAGGADAFIWALDSSGLFSFARQVGSTASELGHALAIDSVGNILTAGSFSGTTDLDPGPGVVSRTSAGLSDTYFLKLNASGLLVWARTVGGTGNDFALDMAVGAGDSIYAAGRFEGAADFDPGAAVSNLTSAGGRDAFVLKLDSSGNFVWADRLGGIDDDQANGIAVDTADSVYTTGTFEGTADFDPGAGVSNLASAGSLDGFVSKRSSSGAFISTQGFGDTGIDQGAGVVVTPLGQIYVGGAFNGTVDFDPGPGVENRTSNGLNDIILLQFTQTLGDRVWHDQNKNGLQDAGEPGLPGVRVELFDSVDGVIGNGDDLSLGKQTTDTDGLYHFPALDTSLSYYLAFQPPIGFRFTAKDAGGDDALDSDADPLTGRTALFTLVPGQNDATRDAGLVPTALITGVTALGEALPVNAATTADQQMPSVASDAQGNFVVVWESFAQDVAATWGIYGQRYNALGQPIGREFLVNTTIAGDQRSPTVAMADNGNFVVAWEGPDADGRGIFARHYAADGQPFGFEFPVNTTTTGEQRHATSAMDVDGDFVVAWDGNGAGDTQGVFARRYSAIGQAQGDEFLVNGNTTNDQSLPALAMDATGDFVVAFQSFGAALYDVLARRFDAAGVAQGDEFLATNTTIEQQIQPAVAMTPAGEFVVSWSNFDQTDFPDRLYDILARRFSSTGAPLSDEFLVTRTITNDQNNAVVALDNAGRFTIAWWDSLSNTIAARAFDANGLAFPDEFQVSGPAANDPAVAMDADGEFVVAWNSPDANGQGVFAQRYSVHQSPAGGQFPVNSETDTTQRFLDVAADAGGNFIVSYNGRQRDGATEDVYAQRFNKAGVPQGSEFRVNTDVDDDELRSSVAMDPDGDFVVAWEANGNQDGNVYGIFAQRFNAVGVPQGPEFLVNVHTNMNQEFPSVAMDADGNFVIAWDDDDNLDGDQQGVFARRFDADGVPLDVPGMPGVSQFQVNTFFAKDQVLPRVAMDPDGDFVVAWQSLDQDGSGYGVYAQRFSAAGAKLGGEFRVNTFTDGNQADSRITMDAAGNFIVSWFSDVPGHYGSFGQRYNAAGAPQGGEFRVFDRTVALEANGNFLSVGGLPDRGSFGVYAQHYAADGTPRGELLRVNTVPGTTESAVALQPNGDFVAVWGGQGPGDNAGIFAQRFDLPQPPRVIVAPDASNEPRVRVLDAQTGAEQLSFLPYGGFTGGIRVAAGDVNGDGTPDIITAAGPGGGPHVRVFNGETGQQLPGLIGSFFAYDPAFSGGVFVAAGDVNGDGFADIVTGADAGGGPHVRVFDGATGAPILGFFPYSPQFTGGARVAVGDLNGDGKADVITAAGAGGGPHVRAFSGANLAVLFEFFAYAGNFSGGVYVASGDINGDGRADVVTGAGAGGGPHVRAFSGAGGQQLPGAIGSFFAFAPDDARGVRVAVVDSSGDGQLDILAATGPGGPVQARLFDAAAGGQQSDFGVPGNTTGGVFVAGATSPVLATSVSGSPLLAAGGAANRSTDPPLTSRQLQPLVAAALARWDAAGLPSDRLQLLEHVSFQVADLPGLLLGVTNANSITLDRDAAGRGYRDQR